MANEKLPGFGFHHVALQVRDFDAALRFYTDALGLTETVRWQSAAGETIALLDMGDGRFLELFSGGDAVEAGAQRLLHFAFGAPDVEAAYKAAIDGGAVPLKPPAVREIAGASRPLILQCAFVRGPGGEEIEFFRFVKGMETV